MAPLVRSANWLASPVPTGAGARCWPILITMAFAISFISNGYRKDVTDLEFLQFAQEQMDPFAASRKNGPQQLIEKMPGLHLPNYLYRNTGNDHFENKAAEWGLEEKTYSNAAAYADLDNDGDLDLVINNVDAHCRPIYKNNSANGFQKSFS
jgi:hypothetical protein